MKDTCCFCSASLYSKTQYVYDKVYKDDCKKCQESNIDESIYCMCNNNGNNYTKMVLKSCSCNQYDIFGSIKRANKIFAFQSALNNRIVY